MHKYSGSLSRVPQSLIHMLIQVILDTYVTLEPQIPERASSFSWDSVRSEVGVGIHIQKMWCLPNRSVHQCWKNM